MDLGFTEAEPDHWRNPEGSEILRQADDDNPFLLIDHGRRYPFPALIAVYAFLATEKEAQL